MKYLCEIHLCGELFNEMQYSELYDWLDALTDENDDSIFIGQYGFSKDTAVIKAQERLINMEYDERIKWLDIIDNAIRECQNA